MEKYAKDLGVNLGMRQGRVGEEQNPRVPTVEGESGDGGNIQREVFQREDYQQLLCYSQ